MFANLRTLLIIGISILLANRLAAQVSMSPTRLFFSGKPGETLVEKVTLYNNGSEDFILNIHKKDWTRSESGEKVYSAAGKLPNSNAAWISTKETNIALPAGGSRDILVTMQVPANASPSEVTNSMLFFSQIGKMKDRESQVKTIGISMLFEFGLHIFYTPAKNMNKSLEILSMESTKQDSSTIAEIRLKNDGNVVCDGKIEFELTNKQTGEEFKVGTVDLSMMPKAEQVFRLKLPPDLKGHFLGVAIVKMAGTNDLRVGEKEFSF